VGQAVHLIVVRLNEWIASVQAEGVDAAIRGLSPTADLSQSSDVMEDIAEAFVQDAADIERKLLSKALQETLYYRVGFDPSIAYDEFKTRFARHLDTQAASSLIKRFLRLYFFHRVWLETGESFRALARSSSEFEEYIDDVEQVCDRTVASVWKSFEKTNRSLDSDTAAELVQKIEERLRGD
jgi:hypothetical protein